MRDNEYMPCKQQCIAFRVLATTRTHQASDAAPTLRESDVVDAPHVHATIKTGRCCLSSELATELGRRTMQRKTCNHWHGEDHDMPLNHVMLPEVRYEVANCNAKLPNTT